MSQRLDNSHNPHIRRRCCDICDDTTGRGDVCACLACGSYPNGKVPLILAQVIQLIGFLFALFVALDCRMTRLPANLVDTFYATHLPHEFYPKFQLNNETNGETRGVGFYFFEDPASKCIFLQHDPQSQADYFDFLGSDFEVSRSLAYWTGIFAFILWVWLMVCSCVANVRSIRHVAAVIASVVFVLLEGLTLIVLRTPDICQEHDCKAGTTLGIVIAAMISFLLSGIAICSTYDYPAGQSERNRLKRQRARDEFGDMIEMTNIPGSGDNQTLENENNNETDHVQEILSDGLGDAREVPVESMFVNATLGGRDDTVQKSTPNSVVDGTR